LEPQAFWSTLIQKNALNQTKFIGNSSKIAEKQKACQKARPTNDEKSCGNFFRLTPIFLIEILNEEATIFVTTECTVKEMKMCISYF